MTVTLKCIVILVSCILKKIFGLNRAFPSRTDAVATVDRAIYAYNNVRPHTSVEKLTPEKAHQLTGELKRQWRKKPRAAIKEDCE